MSFPYNIHPFIFLRQLKVSDEYKQKLIHDIADNGIRMYYDPDKLYNNMLMTLTKLLNDILISPLTTIIIDYANLFNIGQIKNLIQIYLTCTDMNISNIILSAIFPYENYIYEDLQIMQLFQLLTHIPKDCVFDGTKLISYDNDRKIRYSSNNIICVIKFIIPNNIYVNRNFKYFVVVITQNYSVIEMHVASEELFFDKNRPIHTGTIMYSIIKHSISKYLTYYENISNI